MVLEVQKLVDAPPGSYQMSIEPALGERHGTDVELRPARDGALSLGFWLAPQPQGTDIWLSVQDSDPFEFESVNEISRDNPAQELLHQIVGDVVRGECEVVLASSGQALAVRSTAGRWSMDALSVQDGSWASVEAWV